MMAILTGAILGDGAVNVGVGFLGFLALLIEIWALVNLFRRPASAFDAAGVSRGLWVVLLILAIFVCGPGLFVSLFYLTFVDSKVKGAQSWGPGIGGPGGTGNFPR